MLFVLVATAALALTRGYDVDVGTGEVSQKGLLAINSVPDDAFITINGEVHQDRTDTRLKLDPGTYQVKVDRPGVIAWEKRIVIEPGEAVLEEDILLLGKDVPPRTLAETGAQAAAVAPNGREAAWLVTSPSGSVLWRGGLPEGTAQQVAVLPADVGPPTGLAYAPSGDRLLVTTATASLIVETRGGAIGRFPAGGARLLPGRDAEVVVQQGAALVGLSASGLPSVLVPAIGTWTTTADAVYFTDSSGLHRLDPRTSARRDLTAPAPLVELRGSASGDQLLARTADRQLLAWDGERHQVIADNVELYTPNPGASQVAYVANRELRLWKRETGRSELVTRFGEAVEAIGLLPDGHYLLYTERGRLHAIAADGTNDQIIASVGGAGILFGDKVTVLGLDAAGRLTATRLLQD